MSEDDFKSSGDEAEEDTFGADPIDDEEEDMETADDVDGGFKKEDFGDIAE